MKDEPLLELVHRLSSLLGDEAVLIGGVAVSAWGHVRATNDVDFATAGDPDVLLSKLRATGMSCELHRAADLREPIRWAIRGEAGGTPFQIIAEPVRINYGDAVDTPTDHGIIRVAALRDLIRLKLCAGGIHDLWDVAKLLLHHPNEQEWANEQADQFGVRQQLDAWLADPRLSK